MQETKTIVGSVGNMWDFMQQMQEAILCGYRLSDKNDYIPQMLGYSLTATLVKEEADGAKEVQEPPANLTRGKRNAK